MSRISNCCQFKCQPELIAASWVSSLEKGATTICVGKSVMIVMQERGSKITEAVYSHLYFKKVKFSAKTNNQKAVVSVQREKSHHQCQRILAMPALRN